MSTKSETLPGTGTAWSDGTGGTERSPWERWAVLGGFVFVAVGVVTSFLPGAPPASDAPAAKVAAYFRDHAGAIEAQQVIGAIGTITIFWWFGALWRRMTRAEGARPLLATVAVVSFAIGVSLAMASGTMTSTAALRIDSLGDGAQLLWTLSLVTIATAGFAMASFIAATCVLNQRTRFVPAWTNVLGALAALAFVIGGFGAGTDANAVNLFNLVAFLAFCVWIVAVSAYLWSDARS